MSFAYFKTKRKALREARLMRACGIKAHAGISAKKPGWYYVKYQLPERKPRILR